MKSTITAATIFDRICTHLADRDDFWHIVNGPKRETWFTAETIAALSRSGSGSLNDGLRVYGEESYAEIAAILDEYKIPSVSPIPKTDRRRIPDIGIGVVFGKTATLDVHPPRPYTQHLPRPVLTGLLCLNSNPSRTGRRPRVAAGETAGRSKCLSSVHNPDGRTRRKVAARGSGLRCSPSWGTPHARG